MFVQFCINVMMGSLAIAVAVMCGSMCVVMVWASRDVMSKKGGQEQ